MRVFGTYEISQCYRWQGNLHLLTLSPFFVDVEGQLRLVEEVAVKQILEVKPKRGKVSYRHLRKAQQEACIGTRLNHANVVRYRGICLEHGPTGLQLLLVMELVVGNLGQETLQCLLEGGATLSCEPDLRKSLCTGICNGLHYLHALGIVHCDVKPANILLTTRLVPKLCDYGLSSQDDHSAGVFSKSNGNDCQGKSASCQSRSEPVCENILRF